MRRLVVLRPEPGASETVRRAREVGLEAEAMPLFLVEPLPWAAPDAEQFDAMLLTSANAARQAGNGLDSMRRLPVHAVGEATAEASRRAGLTVATIGNSGIDELLGSIEPELRLLHLCGEDRRRPGTARQTITEIPVYRSRELPPPSSLKFIDGAVVLVHSPRAGRRLAELVDQAELDRASISVAAISPAAADAVGRGWAAVEAAERANDDALLALALRLCNKPSSA